MSIKKNQNSKVILVCGSGGVGKTTISASMAVAFASMYKTVVLTIDPAKRLATSLGLNELSDKPTQISFKEGRKNISFDAMMLDTKSTFDRLVEQYAPNDEIKSKILSNKLYQHMSNMMAGTQEYMAMERLYEIEQTGEYELIIVDTPPMQNALDFIEAPQKMINMISNSMLHMLINPSFKLGKAGFKILGKGSQKILKVFDRITGFAFLQDLSEMLMSFQDLLEGFEKRASEIKALLAKPTTLFFAVGTTQKNSILEIESFQKYLEKNNYKLQKVILNRTHCSDILSPKNLKEAELQLTNSLGEKNSKILLNNYSSFLPLMKRDSQIVSSLSKVLRQENILTIPLFLSDIHSIESLKTLSKKLAALESSFS